MFKLILYFVIWVFYIHNSLFFDIQCSARFVDSHNSNLDIHKSSFGYPSRPSVYIIQLREILDIHEVNYG